MAYYLNFKWSLLDSGRGRGSHLIVSDCISAGSLVHLEITSNGHKSRTDHGVNFIENDPNVVLTFFVL